MTDKVENQGHWAMRRHKEFKRASILVAAASAFILGVVWYSVLAGENGSRPATGKTAIAGSFATAPLVYSSK